MRWMTLAASCCAAFFVAGCALFKPVKDRLDTVEHASSCDGRARALVVLLPGRFDEPRDLVDNGFVRAVRERHIDADVVIPDLHLGYYRARTAVDRLHDDVIAPRSGAYEQVWLAGISLGGFGALLHAQQRDTPDGMLLLAPYLGGDRIQNEIRSAGGPLEWDPRTSRAEDYEIEIWQWLRDRGRHTRIIIGYGRDDAFAPANRMLASMLPPGREIAVAGGHDWNAWLAAWERFLDMRMLPSCPARGGG